MAPDTLTPSPTTLRNAAYPVVGAALSGAAVIAGAVAVVTVPASAWIVVPTAGLAVAAMIWVLFRMYVHPRVIAGPTGITVVNPFRSEFCGWDAVRSVTADHALRIELWDGRRVTAWAVQAANLARLLGRESSADRIARAIAELRPTEARPTPGHRATATFRVRSRLLAVLVVLAVAVVTAARFYAGG